MYVGCPGMYKTDTNIKAQKSSFCEGDERNLTVFLKKKKCVLYFQKHRKKILWLLDVCTGCAVCYTGLFLLALLSLNELKVTQSGRTVTIADWQL